MKSVFILITFLLLSITGNSQQLDPFFNKKHNAYSIKNISAFYFQKESDAYRIVELAQKNSAVLKEQDYYLYLMNELTIATFIKHTGDIKGALQLLEKLKKDSFLRKNKTLNAYYNNVSGNVYFQMQSFGKANNYYLKAIELFKVTQDSSGWQGNLINAGNTHSLRENTDSAFLYYNQAMNLDSLGVKTYHLALLTNLARLYNTLSKIEKATEMYEEVYNYSKATNDYPAQIVSSHNLGDCYLGLQRYDEALLVLKEGKKTAIDKGITDHLSSFDRTLSLCYAALTEYDLAYQSLFLYDSAERELSTKHLEEFAETLSIQHQKDLRQKENLIHDQKINRKKAEQQLLIVFLTIASVLLLIILFLYFQKRKKNQFLAKQNFKLVEQSLSTKRQNSDRKEISPELINNIEHYLSDKKKFRNEGLTLDKLAKSLNTNRTYISENINAHYGFSFRVLLNKLRIDDARCMLVDEEFDHFSIEGIAISVGYRNLSSFNVAFKKESGITPSYFRKRNRKTG